jgi:subtilisin-like proprotein convertase family protein
MDARNAMQRIAMILAIVAGAWGSAACVGSVHTYSGDFNLPIPKPDSNDPYTSKGWMADAIIEIPDYFIIADLDIRINITHTNVFDLQLFLKGPCGPKICLNYFDALTEYDIYPNYINTIFDDEAPLLIEHGAAPFTGRFKPRGPGQLKDFKGKDIFGEWRLQIIDMWDWDTGTLNSFELVITSPEPATAVLLTLGFSLMTLLNHHGKQ